MKRRSFVQILTGIIAVPGMHAGTAVRSSKPSPPVSPHPPSALPNPPATAPANPLETLNSLETWLRLPMRPIPSFAALPATASSIELRLAGIILIHIQEIRTALEFAYHGGSEPGNSRRVIPVLLFQKIDPAQEPDAPSPSPIYLLAHCQARHAPRTFRLDRISTL